MGRYFGRDDSTLVRGGGYLEKQLDTSPPLRGLIAKLRAALALRRQYTIAAPTPMSSPLATSPTA